MESKVCLSCRFGSVKIEVLVPEKYNLKEFAQETKDFAADIVTYTRQKPIHYSLKFGEESLSESLGFRVDCTCILNAKRNDCSKFALAEKNCRIKHLDADHKPLEVKAIEVY